MNDRSFNLTYLLHRNHPCLSVQKSLETKAQTEVKGFDIKQKDAQSLWKMRTLGKI